MSKTNILKSDAPKLQSRSNNKFTAFLLDHIYVICTFVASFFLMTLALVLGALWGKICWGDWWQYDPKEMWSLATWLTFAGYFHFRSRARVRVWLLRFGALMIILTLTWVNFARIFRGLHSYV